MQAAFVVIDTETTGLCDFTQPADAPCQPRLASLAMIHCDIELQVVSESYVLIRPDGWTMPEAAERINGLSTAQLLADGIPVHTALEPYIAAIDGGATIVAHNAQYDTKVLRGELRRLGFKDRYGSPTICTMRLLTEACALPSRNGRGFKFPKLTEAIRRLLGEEMNDAHNALADARGCLSLLCEARRRDIELPHHQLGRVARGEMMVALA